MTLRVAGAAAWSTTVQDGVMIARFAHPPAHYYTDVAVDELAGLVRDWAAMDLCAVILAGASTGHFVTHFDPEQILAGLDDPELVAARGPVRNVAVNRVLDELARLPMPIIAALNGDAMGFGFELALACDLRIGQNGDFRYGLPEVRLGIIPGAGGTQRLSRLVGLGTALNLVMRAKVVDPETALALGLLTELHDDAVAASMDIAAEFAALPRSSVGLAKRALHLGVDATLATGLNIESEASVRSKLSPMAVAALNDYLMLPLAARRTWLEGRHQSWHSKTGPTRRAT